MEWPLVKLGDICRIELGKTPSRGDASLWDKEKTGLNIWLSIADLPLTKKPVMLDSKEFISDKGARLCKVIPAGTLLVSFKLSLGRLAYAGTDLYSNEAIAALYIGNDINIAKDYLYWALTNFDWDNAVGADVKVKGKTLNKAKLKEIPIPLPPIPEQQRIVAILDQAFADIEKARANTEKNLKNARELFDSYLNQVLSQRGEGWVNTTLESVCKTTQGIQIPKPGQFNELKQGLRRYLYISDFKTDKSLKYVKDCHPNKLVSKDDLVVVNTGNSAGDIFYGIDGVLSNNLFMVSFDSTIFVKEYLYHFINSGLFKEHQSGIRKGTANPHMGHENFKSTPFRYPVISQQQKICKNLDRISVEVNQLESKYLEKLASLDELKNSLLQKAFSGELTKTKGHAA